MIQIDRIPNSDVEKMTPDIRSGGSKLKYLLLLAINAIVFTFITYYAMPMGETQYYQKLYSKSFEKDRELKAIEIAVRQKEIIIEQKETVNQERELLIKIQIATLQDQEVMIQQQEAVLQQMTAKGQPKGVLIKAKELLLQLKYEHLQRKDEITSEQFAYFKAKKSIFQQKKAAKQLNPPYKKGVTAVFNSCNRYDLLGQSLQSFFTQNKYPLQKVIVAQDGPVQPDISQIMKVYPNITWLIMGQRMGQLKTIDEAYKLVETQYMLHSEDDWIYLKQGFIEASIAFLETHPNVVNYYFRVQSGEFNPQTSMVDLEWFWGFSFNPSLRRMRDYKIIPGGYAGVTKNRSYGHGADKEQTYMVVYYKKLGYRTAQPKEDYIFHIGALRSRHSQ